MFWTRCDPAELTQDPQDPAGTHRLPAPVSAQRLGTRGGGGRSAQMPGASLTHSLPGHKLFLSVTHPACGQGSAAPGRPARTAGWGRLSPARPSPDSARRGAGSAARALFSPPRPERSGTPASPTAAKMAPPPEHPLRKQRPTAGPPAPRGPAPPWPRRGRRRRLPVPVRRCGRTFSGPAAAIFPSHRCAGAAGAPWCRSAGRAPVARAHWRYPAAPPGGRRPSPLRYRGTATAAPALPSPPRL